MKSSNRDHQEITKLFSRESVQQEDGQWRMFMFIHCGTPGCPAKLGLDDSNGSPKNVRFFIESFKKKHWIVGTRKGDHCCPDCADRERQRGIRKDPPPPISLTEHIAAKRKDIAPMVSPPIHERPTREPSRDENNRIRDRLDEVHDYQDNLYYRPSFAASEVAGDKRLAEEIGFECPMIWVQDIRRMFFNPVLDDEAGPTAELRAVSAQITALQERVKADCDAAVKLIEEAASGSERMVNVTMADAMKEMKALQAKVEKLMATFGVGTHPHHHQSRA